MEEPTHRYPCQIAFADTDASGWMHFPAIFRHVEAAEHECLKQRGVLVFDRALGGWPRVSVTCDYKKPLLAGDVVEVRLAIGRIGNASIQWNFEVVDADGQLAVVGSMTNVRVDGSGKPQEISECERKALGCNER